jgi:peptidyl-prolyl cis-trans isomerase D
LEKKTTDLFSRDASGLDILAHPQVIAAAFSPPVLEEGRNSEVIQVEDRHLAVLRLKQHEAAKPQSLEEVKTSIIERLKQDKTQQAATELGKALLGELAAGQQDQQTLAAQRQLNWEAPQWVTRQAMTFPRPELLEAAFRLGYPAENQALYQGVALPNGDYALLALLAVKPGEAGEDSQMLENHRMALGQSEFQQFLASVKQRAKIQIYADKL